MAKIPPIAWRQLATCPDPDELDFVLEREELEELGRLVCAGRLPVVPAWVQPQEEPRWDGVTWLDVEVECLRRFARRRPWGFAQAGPVYPRYMTREVWRLAHRCAREGLSRRETARRLNAQGSRTLRGKLWQAGQISQLLANTRGRLVKIPDHWLEEWHLEPEEDA